MLAWARSLPGLKDADLAVLGQQSICGAALVHVHVTAASLVSVPRPVDAKAVVRRTGGLEAVLPCAASAAAEEARP